MIYVTIKSPILTKLKCNMVCGVHQYVIDSTSYTKYETDSLRFE